MTITADRVRQSAGAPGTGSVLISGSTAGYRDFSAAFTSGDVLTLCIESQTPGSWEVCESTYTAGALSRGTLLASSTGARVDFTGPVFAFATFSGAQANLVHARLQTVANARLIGRRTAGPGLAEEVTLSELLDFIGSAAQGDILYRGASGWARLAAGVIGRVLTSGGGAADVVWGADVPGNAGTATALQTARTIDGVTFDGTANITVLAPATHAATGKATPVDADEMPLVDSAAGNVLKRLTWANLKATLAAVFAPFAPNVTTITYAGTISVDLTGKPDGALFRCTLTGNVTVNFTGGTDGQKCVLELTQDATGSRLVTLGSAVGYGTAIPSFTATTTASKTDVLGFVYKSTAAKYLLLAVNKGF